MRPLHTLALVLCLAAVPALHADDASHRAKAEQMLQLTHTDSMMKEQLANLQERINSMAKQQFSQGSLTPAQTSLTTTYLKQVQDLTDDEVGWEKLRPAVVQNYADTFTDADLDGIIAFYKSPAGNALLTKSPAISNKTMVMVQDKIKELQPKLAQITEDYAGKMKASAPAPAASPAAPAAKPAAPTAKPGTAK
jgi:hypothetical protein